MTAVYLRYRFIQDDNTPQQNNVVVRRLLTALFCMIRVPHAWRTVRTTGVPPVA